MNLMHFWAYPKIVSSLKKTHKIAKKIIIQNKPKMKSDILSKGAMIEI